MRELSEKEIIEVENKLKDLGIDYKPLQEDLLDHICIEIEMQIAENHSFEFALPHTLAKFENEHKTFVELQKDILKEVKIPIRRKRKRKIVGLSTLLASLFFLFSLVVQAHEKPDIYPVQDITNIGFDNHHKQTIFTLQKSQEVQATANGVVLEVSEINQSILIKHSNGYFTFYKNLDKIVVKKGDKIQKKNIIAWIKVEKQYTKQLFYQIIRNGKFIY